MKFTAAISLTAICTVAGAETFIPASDPRITYAGRTQITANGTRVFDWEAVSIYASVTRTTYLKMALRSGGRTRFIVSDPTSSLAAQGLSNGFVMTNFWADPIADSMTGGIYYAASGLDSTQNYTLRMFNDLEPEFHGSSGAGYGTGSFEFIGLYVDGDLNPATPPLSRALEWVGDSLTAGFGSHGRHPPCETNQYSSGNYGSYDNLICDAFNANCSTIAWSGKGIFVNCCDEGETMPGYFTQTLGLESYSNDWDFDRFTPAAVAINIGTNDYSKYNGTNAFNVAFETVLLDFILNVTQVYYAAAPPVIMLVQGPFNSSLLYAALQVVVANATAAGVKAHYVSAIVDATPDGCQGHPGQVMHPQMAAVALPQMGAIMGWNYTLPL